MRAEHKCLLCQQEAFHAHHIWGKNAYPSWRHELWNGVALCPQDHHFVHAFPKKGREYIIEHLPDGQLEILLSKSADMLQ
jgi:hypothetical protein